MRTNSGRIHCQCCLALNSLEREHCARCGTVLMLVVEPSALRYEEETVAAAVEHDEHLLERISALECQLTRTTERVEQAVELLLRHAHTSYSDHVLLETLLLLLGEDKIINRSKLNELARRRSAAGSGAAAAKKPDVASRQQKLCGQILVSYDDGGGERDLFTRLVREGFALFEKDRTEAGVKTLERAAALAPASIPLNRFLGEHFFRAGKTALARDYLGRAFSVDPSDYRVCLLLGLACGDEGEATRAKDLLSEAVRQGGACYAAFYGLGRLRAAAAEWEEALVEFKCALTARPCPEAHYVVGFVYHQLGRQRMALRHLLKTIGMDPEYAEAYYLLGFVRLQLGERKLAAAAFRAAYELNKAEPRYRAALRRPGRASEALPPLLFGALRRDRTGLVTGGDSRLAAALQEDALKLAAAR